ncbi:MAG: carbohydrate ABC transporter permease [Bacillota bacterium]|nr:MAG: carbohydrate ABC transporter permease [Bacillota bacterium]
MTAKLNLTKIRKKLFGHKATSGLIGKIFVYGLLIGISYVYLYPLLRMISMSFLTQSDLLNPEVDWIPKSLKFSNFVVANRVLGVLPPSLMTIADNPFRAIFGIFQDGGNLWKSMKNVGFLALIQTIIAALTGFAFARYEFKFKKTLFVLVLVSFVVPLPMVTIPRIIMISEFQDKYWIPFDKFLGDNFIGNIVKPTLFNSLMPQITFAIFGQGINSAILILIFFNFFKMIPISLDEAARIDGASSFQVFYHIYIKLVIPIIFTVFLFSFVWNWNDVYSATIYYRANNPLVIMRLNQFDDQFAGLANIPGQSGELRLNEAYKMAATFITVLPLLILYIFAQKKFIEGIERTGMTGE